MKKAGALLNSDVLHAARETLRASLKEVPKYTSGVKGEVVTRFNNANDYYKRVTGIDELDRCQNRVNTLQEQLLEAQEQRRTTGLKLAEIRVKSNELQDQLHKVKRQENLQQFLDLMRDETEILRREQDITSVFQEQDRKEREIFTAFTNAIRDSHEKQRNRLEHMKYWGMILSIAGSFISFTLSSLKTEDVKRVIANSMRSNYEPVKAKLTENESVIVATMESMKRENERLLGVLEGAVASGALAHSLGVKSKNVISNEVKLASNNEVVAKFKGENPDRPNIMVENVTSNEDKFPSNNEVVTRFKEPDRTNIMAREVIKYSLVVAVGYLITVMLHG